MSFLDNFSWAFQPIKLLQKQTTIGKYGEIIETGTTETSFLGVIQEKKDFSQYFIGDGQSLGSTSKDYELRCPSNITPSKGDKIESFGNTYTVVYFESVIIDGSVDHTVCTIKLEN